MNLYKQKLIDEGFSDTNATRIAKMIDLAHYTMCKMDQNELTMFKGKTVDQRIHDFSKIEEVRDVYNWKPWIDQNHKSLFTNKKNGSAVFCKMVYKDLWKSYLFGKGKNMERTLKIEIDSGQYTCSNCEYLNKEFPECNLLGENIYKDKGHYYRCCECVKAEKFE